MSSRGNYSVSTSHPSRVCPSLPAGNAAWKTPFHQEATAVLPGQEGLEMVSQECVPVVFRDIERQSLV